MSLWTTIALMAAAIAVAGLAHMMQRRPRTGFEPPWVPWTAVQVIAVVLAILLAAHLVSLATGQQLKGRSGL